MAKDARIIGRIAPSPSGLMHLGNAFSSLLAWGHARSRDGSFVLRLEDLDERCRKQELHEALVNDLRWLGIDWDGELVVQSAQLDRYQDALEKVSSKAHTYPCFCTRADLHAASAPHASDGTPIYAGTCLGLSDDEVRSRMNDERHALRLHVPDASVSFRDLIQGDYVQSLKDECGDFVLQRSDGVHAYQLVCVVDDIESGVTEIVRGSDLLSSTPRQLLLYDILGATAPEYAHHPLLLAEDGRRLAKRDQDLTLASLRDGGAKSEQVVGYVASLAGFFDSAEPMSASEFVDAFDLERIPKDDIVVSHDDVERVFG